MNRAGFHWKVIEPDEANPLCLRVRGPFPWEDAARAYAERIAGASAHPCYCPDGICTVNPEAEHWRVLVITHVHEDRYGIRRGGPTAGPAASPSAGVGPGTMGAATCAMPPR